MNYNLEIDETVKYIGMVTSTNYRGDLNVILTTKKVIIERKGIIFKNKYKVLDLINLNNIKFNNKVGVNQNNNNVDIIMYDNNITLTFYNDVEAAEFANILIETKMGKNVVKNILGNGIEKVKNKAKDAVDFVKENPEVVKKAVVAGVNVGLKARGVKIPKLK